MSDYINEIKSIPIINYAESLGFEIVRKGKYYSLREHDSVRINAEKNCFWRNSVFKGRGTGGAGSIIDFAIEFCGYNSASEAIKSLAFAYGVKRRKVFHQNIRHETTPLTVRKVKTLDNDTNNDTNKKTLALPLKSENNNAVFYYLCKERNIDLSVVRYMFAKKLIYEDTKHNCVFVSNNFACVRSTSGSYVGDVAGSNYYECFYLRCNLNSTTLVVTESVIDMMSVMTYFLKMGGSYTDYCYLALCGTAKLSSLYYHVEQEKSFTSVMLALDNDEAGRSATNAAQKELNRMNFNGNIVDFKPFCGKDWNDCISIIATNPTNCEQIKIDGYTHGE